MAGLDYDKIKQQIDLAELHDDILNDPYDLAISVILDENAVQQFTEGARVNTDDFPVLEFHSPQGTERENWSTNLYELIKVRVPPQPIIHSIPDMTLFDRYLTAQRYFLSALIYKNKGELDKMLQALQMAARINPENTEITDYLAHELRQLGHR